MPKGARIINRVCLETGYTRQHVSTMLRKNAKALGASRDGNRQWVIRDEEKAFGRLLAIVKSSSGLRCKLGEKKPRPS